MTWPWFRAKPEVTPARDPVAMIREIPELKQLAASLGYDPELEEEVARVMRELKAQIRADITAFDDFCLKIRAAAEQSPGYEVPDRALLEEILAAGPDSGAVLAILNRDPVNQQLPYIERVPVLKGGGVTWLTPMQHPNIEKRPADVHQFTSLIGQLETLFAAPHTGRDDQHRLEVQETIARIRRELSREKPYLPSLLQTLDARIYTWLNVSRGSPSQRSLKRLLELLSQLEQVRWACENGQHCHGLASTAAKAAGAYQEDEKLRSRWLTDYLLSVLLAEPLVQTTAWLDGPARKRLRLIRSEILSGSYGAECLQGRIRRLEDDGLYASSLVYLLLGAARRE
jgi:hypothetical protein